MRDYRDATPNRRSQYYLRFPAEEYERRWAELRGRMDEAGLDAIVVHGNSGFQSVGIEYLTNYAPPFATYLVAFADEDRSPTLFVGISNHLQFVREVSIIDDLRLMLHDPAGKLVDCLVEGGAGGGRIGLTGFDPRYDLGMPYKHYRRLDSDLDVDLVDETDMLLDQVSRKSDAELERVRKAAAILDDGMAALGEAARPGTSEIDLHAALASATANEDGGLNNAFICSAPMVDAEPGEPIPWKGEPSKRRLAAGDVITTETSVEWGGYASQIHRPYAVESEPTQTYREMFDLSREVAESMIDVLRPGNTSADIHEALMPIEESDYKLYDVGLHGYANGYLHPFVGTANSNYWPGADDPVTAEWTFEEGMVMVVQPNVTTPNERHSLQLGTTVIVGDPPEDVHEFPLEFVRT